ncbi:MAG: SEC-C metal-binding domain-containing protein [Verrucomicrobiota bacterium]
MKSAGIDWKGKTFGYELGPVEAFGSATADDTAPDAPPSPFIPSPKVGRNEQCPCGSGKKFKRCCGR